MNTFQLKTRLQALTTAQVNMLSVLSGVSVRTLWLIRSGVTESAREGTVSAIAAALRKLPKGKA